MYWSYPMRFDEALALIVAKDPSNPRNNPGSLWVMAREQDAACKASCVIGFVDGGFVHSIAFLMNTGELILDNEGSFSRHMYDDVFFAKWRVAEFNTNTWPPTALVFEPENMSL